MAAVRSRLPVLLPAALLVGFWVELALRAPAGTPHRLLAALALALMAGGLAAGRRAPLVGVLAVFGAIAVLPALSRVYYDDLVLPYLAPFVAAYLLGANATGGRLMVGLVARDVLGLAGTVPYDDDT